MGTPCLSALPEPDLTESLERFLQVFDEHPNLADFRRICRTRPDRQLALFAALERAVVIGSPAASQPNLDDEADQILCDLLDVINTHPVLKNSGAYYGPHRHLANLQAFGVWLGNAPIAQPSARELFTTAFASLNSDPASDLPASEPINSPASQGFTPNGELIASAPASQTGSDQPVASSQAVDGVLVVSLSGEGQVTANFSNSSGIIHHDGQSSGEKLPAAPPDPNSIPARPVRRGRPMKLDDIAKGKLLGLMSYGLSFRQAAAQLGVHHVTLLNALKRDEEFAQQISEARLNAISQPLLTVIQASRTNWRAVPTTDDDRLQECSVTARLSKVPDEDACDSSSASQSDLSGDEVRSLTANAGEPSSKPRDLARGRYKYDCWQKIYPCRELVGTASIAPAIHVRCHEIGTKSVSFFITDCPDFGQLVVALGSDDNPVFMAAEVEHSKVVSMYGEVGYLVGCRFIARLPEFSERSRVQFNKRRDWDIPRFDQAVSAWSQNMSNQTAQVPAELIA